MRDFILIVSSGAIIGCLFSIALLYAHDMSMPCEHYSDSPVSSIPARCLTYYQSNAKEIE